MLIDTHCHVDQFPSPEEVVRDCEGLGLRVVAVTNLPAHFALAADRLRGHPLVSAALGMHPLCANEGIQQLDAFKRMAPHVDFVGEIGLDFTRQGAPIRAQQERVFDAVLQAIKDRPRFITLHSRQAERAVLGCLQRHEIRGAVFHWFSGSARDLARVIDDGHYVSVNAAMLGSASGERVVEGAPREAVLVESDGPFAKRHGRASHPRDIQVVYEALAAKWKVEYPEAVEIVAANFSRILLGIDLQG